MQSLAFFLSALVAASVTSAAPAPASPNVVSALYDGKCYYPTADPSFVAADYLGKWYQIAGTIFPFTAACKCVQAEYSLKDDGSIGVNNTCQTLGKPVSIIGSAIPAGEQYGGAALKVSFPGTPSICPGPNYIVQKVTADFAIVQAPDFLTLFILSRKRNVEDAVINEWIAKAGELGTNLATVVKNDQTGCVI